MYLTVQTRKQIVLIHENAKVIIDSEDVWCEIAVAQAVTDCQQQSQCRARCGLFQQCWLYLYTHIYVGGAQGSSLCCEKKNKYNHTTKTKSSLSLGSVSFSVLVSLRCCVFLLRLLPQQDGEALKRFIWTNSLNFVGKNSLKVKRKEKKIFCLPSDVDFFP